MLSPFSCGFFHHEDVDEESTILSPCSTPRRSRRSSKDSKNPYSSRGLEKFSALLADLDEKRQKIYAQTPPQDISFVRFVFKDSNDTADPIPIVVKLKDNRREDINSNKKINTNKVDQQNQVVVNEKHVTTALEKFTIEPSTPTKEVGQQTKSYKRAFSSSGLINFMNLGMWRRPSYYLPVVLVFILVLLAVFGKSVAILCTSIGWYALPTLNEASRKHTRSSKKKHHVTKLRDNNKMATEHHGSSSPKSNKTAPGTPRSQQHGHRKSW